MNSNIQQPLRKGASLINHPPQPYVGDLPTQSLPTEPHLQRQHVPNKSRMVCTSDDIVFKDKASLTFSSLHSHKTVSFLFRVVIFLALSITIVLIKNQTQYQGRAAGTGNVYYANPGDDLTAKASVLQPGDTLILHDGIYANQHIYLQNVHATATAPITIQAEHDGQATVDGGATTSNVHGIYLGHDSYITVQGFSVHNDYGDNIALDGSDHIRLKRMTAWDAGIGNTAYFGHVFDVSGGSSSVLVEDCAAYGHGRYDFIAYHSRAVTFRRDFAMSPSEIITSAAPRSTFGVYGSSSVLLENDIGVNAIPATSDDNYYSSVWHTSDDPTNFPVGQTTYLGDIFYNNCEGIKMTNTSGNNVATNNTTYKDIYIDIPSNTACQTYTTKYNSNSRGIDWEPSYGGSITNATFINAASAGFNLYGTSGHPPITNSIFLNNQTANTGGDPGQSYSDFFGNGSYGVALNSTDKTVNPGYNTATYGRGAYLMPAPSLLGQGQNGADIGSHIIYEYVDGQLTNTPLWPWPMEDRIMAEKGISVTWSANGGIWKTLNGVYAKVTIAPTPTYSSTPTPTPISSNTLPPTVTILSPVNGGTVSPRSKVTITASASEGVTQVTYSIKGSLLCTSTTSPYSCSWSVPRKPNATYTITATAYDVAGYTGTNSVSVTAK
jgi:hypothetical protein